MYLQTYQSKRLVHNKPIEKIEVMSFCNGRMRENIYLKYKTAFIQHL